MYMKTIDRRIKLQMFILLGVIFLLAGMAVVFLWNTNQQAAIMPGQFVLVRERPVIIKEGNVYEYGTDGIWRHLELIGEAKQIVGGEILCVLNEDGSLYYDNKIDLGEGLPLTSAYALYMAEKALILNKDEPFAWINQSLEYLDFRALLRNGDILYQGLGEYDRYQMDEETPIFLSGSYIMTSQGNVYYLKIDTDGYSGIMNTDLKCVYDGKDIVTISASETAARCLGLRENGTVISFSDIAPLEVTDWKNVIAIQQGFNYAVGLTAKGSVLYVDYNASSTEEVTKALESWTDIVQMAAYSDIIVGLKRDGSCLFLDISVYK